jgi:WD40 repeat protein
VGRRIFLSYARGDAEPIAARLERDLAARGHTVWRDRNQLVPGVSWEDQCAAAIRDAEVVLALVSPMAVRGERARSAAATDSVCLYEISYARHHGIPIVPALLATCDLPLTICRLHCEDLRAWDESEAYRADAVDRVAGSVEAAAAKELRLRQDTLPETIDFIPFLSRRRREFTGRDWLFKRLDRMLADHARAVLVSGDPGIGKSAIVAELVYTNPDSRILAYYCCQWDDPDTLDAGRFVAHLAGMIASRIEEYGAGLAEQLRVRPLPLDKPLTAFRRAIVDPLSRLARPPGGPRYILIDALDESLEGRAGADNPTGAAAGESAPVDGKVGIVAVLAEYLPELPDWLRVVATTRDDREVLAHLDALNGIQLHASDSLNRKDVDDYIGRRLASPPLADRAGSVPDAAGKISTAADGNFLVARTVLDALVTGTLPFDQIGRLAPGLPNIYRRFFERLFPTGASYQAPALVLGALIVAEEPLDIAQLAAVTGLDPRSALRDALEQLAAFVPANRGRYGLFHKSLADWLTRDDEKTGRIARQFHVEKASFHRRFADMCWAEYERGPQAMSRYALLNLPNHLFRANVPRVRELEDRHLGVLLDGRYLTARVAAEGPSLRSLVNDYIDAEVGTYDLHHRLLPALELVGQAMRLSAHAVTLDRTQLAGQLAGRLGGFDLPEIRATVAGALAYRGATWLRPLTPSLVPAGGLLRWTFRGRPAGHKGTVRSIAISTDGFYALTAGNSHLDQTVKVWDLFQGELRWSWPEAAADGGQTALALLPGLAVASYENRLQVWSIGTGARLHAFDAHATRITALAVADEGKLLVSAAADGTVRTWEPGRLPGEPRTLQTGAPVAHLAVVDGRRLLVTQSNAGATAAFSLDTLDRVADAEAEAFFAPLAGDWPGYGRPVNPIALDPSGAYSVTAQGDGGLQVWHVKRKEDWASLGTQGSRVCAAAVTADGRTAVSAQFDHDLKVWDLSRYEARSARPHRGSVDSIVLLPGDQVAVVKHRSSTNDAPDVVVWDWEPDAPVELEPSTFTDRVVEDARDALGDSQAHLEDVVRAIEERGPFPDMHLAAATPDGRLAVFTTAPRPKGSDSEKHWLLVVWDVAGHAIAATLSGHHGMVFSAAISDDGTLVASASEDATVKLWRLPDGACLATFTGDSEMYAIAMTPDASLIAAGERSGSLHLLQIV